MAGDARAGQRHDRTPAGWQLDSCSRCSSRRAGDFVFVERFGSVIWEHSPEDGAMRLGVQLWLPDDLPSGAWELVVQATDLATGRSTDAGVQVTVLSAAR